MRLLATVLVCAVAVAAVAACGGADSPAVCSTNSEWSGGEGPTMSPGGDCIACHAKEGEGPQFQIAGTVMQGVDDSENCNGVEGVTVQITGSDGKVLTLMTNSAGNFTSDAAVAVPFTAKVMKGGKERVMAAAQTSGNCASCHTDTGASGAPGRIQAP